MENKSMYNDEMFNEVMIELKKSNHPLAPLCVKFGEEINKEIEQIYANAEDIREIVKDLKDFNDGIENNTLSVDEDSEFLIKMLNARKKREKYVANIDFLFKALGVMVSILENNEKNTDLMRDFGNEIIRGKKIGVERGIFNR